MPNKPNKWATLRPIQYGIVELSRLQKVDAAKCTLNELTDKQNTDERISYLNIPRTGNKERR